MPEGIEKTFAWIGCAIINIAFISFIAWGASTDWWIGFVVSACYTAILFALAHGLESLLQFQYSNDLESPDNLNGCSVNESHRPSMLITLLYGLATVSLGITGSFLPSNIIDCSNYPVDETQAPHCRQNMAIAYFFLSALPMTVSSIYLWYKRQLPSMGITTFIGISGIAFCGFFALPSKSPDESEFFKWWTLCFGGIWVILTTNGILSSMEAKPPMRWGLNVGSLAYFAGGIAVLDIFASSTIVHWLVFNAAILAPLCLLGLGTQSSFLLVLTATGVVMDAIRICELFTRNLDETFSALIYFLVLGSTGLLTAVLGWLLSRRQQEIAFFICAYLEPYAWPRRETISTPSHYHQASEEDSSQIAVVAAGTEKTFAWIGCLIVNAAFISFISWGASANWWIGFVVSVCYTAILFAFVLVMDSSGSFFTIRFLTNDAEYIDRFNESCLNESHRPSVLITLLYGLAILALGVTGSFLPSNVIDCYPNETHCPQTKAIAYFFLSALPMTVASIYLWYKRHVPSMGITSFIGISGIACCVFYAMSSKSPFETVFLQWWALIFGGMWTILTTNGIMSSIQHKAPMRWGLNIGSLAFFIGGISVLGLDASTSTMVHWVIFNAVILVPLCVLGLASQSGLLLVLTGVGVFIDALHICDVWTRNLNDTFTALTYFLVLGFTGLLIAFSGWLLSRRQQEISLFLCGYLQPYAWPRHRETAFTTDGSYQTTKDEDGPTSTYETGIA